MRYSSSDQLTVSVGMSQFHEPRWTSACVSASSCSIWRIRSSSSTGSPSQGWHRLGAACLRAPVDLGGGRVSLVSREDHPRSCTHCVPRFRRNQHQGPHCARQRAARARVINSREDLSGNSAWRSPESSYWRHRPGGAHHPPARVGYPRHLRGSDLASARSSYVVGVAFPTRPFRRPAANGRGHSSERPNGAKRGSGLRQQVRGVAAPRRSSSIASANRSSPLC